MTRTSGIDITVLPKLQHILIDDASRQHLVLRAHGVILQVVVDGAEGIRVPVSLGLFILSCDTQVINSS